MKDRIEEYTKHYHTGNHLSSTQLVTDGTGVAIQQVEYAPFGEVVNEYNIDWNSGQVPDFKFNGKELDEENGMYYFEARYQSTPVFISRDILFEEKPFMSPYSYCRNNPLNMVDPSGNDEYEFNKKGKLLRTKENDKADVVRIVETDRKGNIKQDKNGNTKIVAQKSYEFGTIDNVRNTEVTVNPYEGKEGTLPATIIDLKNDAQREDMFKFLAKNTRVEWGTVNGNDNHGNDINTIFTGGQTASLKIAVGLIEYYYNGYTLNDFSHNHPASWLDDYAPWPSGYSSKDGQHKGDRGFTERYYSKIKQIRVYDPYGNVWYMLHPDKYDKNYEKE
ncbi:MAG: hypothetical protein LBR36_02130 [Bacteroidales bacterium]|jgi:RHS repeat-associated protein|nr:hypothetical protein [Bacteroidales bacterium]